MLDDVIKCVLEIGIVVIIGKVGDGKIIFGFFVFCYFYNVCYLILINFFNLNLYELYKIFMIDKNCVLLMDDIFGKINFEIKCFERW